MAKETEIKLRASAATLDALRAHPLLKKRCKDGWQRHELSNCYYDTDTRDTSDTRHQRPTTRGPPPTAAARSRRSPPRPTRHAGRGPL